VAAAAAAAAATAAKGRAAGPAGCEDAGVTSSRAKIILFGDSLTQLGFSSGGWVQRLADTYCRRADLLNRGYSGYNTRWATPALEALLTEGVGCGDDAVLWTLWLGANDAAQPETHRQHVPLAEYEDSLTAMVQAIQASSPSHTSIVLITPPPVCEKKYMEVFMLPRNPSAKVPDRTDEVAGSYAAAVRRVGAACKVPVLDVYKAMHAQEQPPGHFLSDGIHLNEAGGELVCRLITALIEDRFPWLAVKPCRFTGAFHNSGTSSALPQEFPWHDSIDAKNPPKSFSKL